MESARSDGPARPPKVDADVGESPLPSWLTARLAEGPARFGVLLHTGHVLVVDSIRQLRIPAAAQGIVWLDVEIVVPFKKEGFPWGHFPLVKRTEGDRATCSINLAHVVAMVEVDTWEVPPLQPSEE